jgi:uncharacterized protein YicC (UPF0701 family)
VRINAQIANTVIPQLRSIAEELGLGATLTGSDLMRVPDFLQVEPLDAEIADEERESLVRLVREAFAQMTAMRAREGESLRNDIAARMKSIRDLASSSRDIATTCARNCSRATSSACRRSPRRPVRMSRRTASRRKS